MMHWYCTRLTPKENKVVIIFAHNINQTHYSPILTPDEVHDMEIRIKPSTSYQWYFDSELQSDLSFACL